jgi:hypothetical protein
LDLQFILEKTTGKRALKHSMIPKFSIRQMLLLMIAIGIVAACMAGAARGNRIAFGLSVAIIGSILPFVVMAIVQWFSFAMALISTLADQVPEKELSYAATASPVTSDQVDSGIVGAEIVGAEIVGEIDPGPVENGDA